MDTLQLQDVFAPYYAGRDTDDRTRRDGEATVTRQADTALPDHKARLDTITRRLARLRRRTAARGI